eukprot:COSAG03_NODE_1837_length_3455_cov_3.077473_3_plen_69_part_00
MEGSLGGPSPALSAQGRVRPSVSPRVRRSSRGIGDAGRHHVERKLCLSLMNCDCDCFVILQSPGGIDP